MSDLWSKFSEATSLTSLSSGRSKAPKLDLHIPNHLLGDREMFGDMPDLYDNAPQRPHAGPSNQETSQSLDRNQGILLLSAENSQSTQATNDHFHDLPPIKQAMQSHLRTFYVGGCAVTSGTLEGLVQFLIVGFGELRTLNVSSFILNSQHVRPAGTHPLSWYIPHRMHRIDDSRGSISDSFTSIIWGTAYIGWRIQHTIYVRPYFPLSRALNTHINSEYSCSLYIGCRLTASLQMKNCSTELNFSVKRQFDSTRPWILSQRKHGNW